MRNLPEVNLSYDPLTRMLYGAIPARLLLSAIELRVFAHLSEAMTPDSLAGRIGTHRENTRLFLDGLVANELLHKKHGQYQNTPIAEAFLVEGRPTYLGDVLMNLAGWMRPALDHMTVMVKEGEAPEDAHCKSLGDPFETEIYGNFQRAGRAQQAAAIISRLPEFPHMRKMLDLGGGAGLIGLAIVAAHPNMTGVIFDRPEVVETTKRFICEYEMQDRVSTIGGDYTRDSIGEGYDLVWTSFTLNFCRGNLVTLFRKIHAALNPGGVFACLAEGLTDERARPAEAVNSLLAVTLGGCDVMFDEGEIAQAMLDAGFRSVHSRLADRLQPHGPANLDIARR